MSAVLIKGKREDLFREITGVLHKWPDLEQKVFARAHYHGQSLETISNSLNVDVQKVSSILEKCDRELLFSLRNYREGRNSKQSSAANKSTGSIE